MYSIFILKGKKTKFAVIQLMIIMLVIVQKLIVACDGHSPQPWVEPQLVVCRGISFWMNFLEVLKKGKLIPLILDCNPQNRILKSHPDEQCWVVPRLVVTYVRAAVSSCGTWPWPDCGKWSGPSPRGRPPDVTLTWVGNLRDVPPVADTPTPPLAHIVSVTSRGPGKRLGMVNCNYYHV